MYKYLKGLQKYSNKLLVLGYLHPQLIGENAPVSQRSDDQTARVSQVLIAVLKARVGLTDDAVFFLL